MDEFKEIRQQSAFCMELMRRLDCDIKKAGRGSWSGMDAWTRKQNDIIRVRRELRALFLMLDPWRREDGHE